MATTLGNGTITFGDGTTLSTASMIQSIQRGTVTKAWYPDGGVYTGNNGVVNISAVVTAKCMVILTGTGALQGGDYARFGSSPFMTAFNSTTQFSWVTPLLDIYITTSFSWQVIEFK
jgi:hypothetical protein